MKTLITSECEVWNSEAVYAETSNWSVVRCRFLKSSNVKEGDNGAIIGSGLRDALFCEINPSDDFIVGSEAAQPPHGCPSAGSYAVRQYR